MPNRRAFLTGLLATGLAPAPSWSDVGSPHFLSAGMTANGTHALYGLSAEGHITFRIPIPDRGHAAAAHPTRPDAVAFARRPGRFAVVIDCTTRRETARLRAPTGRHFYGHGAFSKDGSRLFTTENDYENARGVIGIWDTRRNYARIDEVSSGGIGPHDIKRLPNTDVLVVANGGIETHPETGRAKLNLSTMLPNLCYIDANGLVRDLVELAPELRKNSIRHLAVAGDGTVAFAMQWQGDLSQTVPVLGLHNAGTGHRLVSAADHDLRRMQGYAGSIALSASADTVAVTSPRGGVCQVYDTRSGTLSMQFEQADICGVAASGRGFLTTAGTGQVKQIANPNAKNAFKHDVLWDNHLVSLNHAASF